MDHYGGLYTQLVRLPAPPLLHAGPSSMRVVRAVSEAACTPPLNPAPPPKTKQGFLRAHHLMDDEDEASLSSSYDSDFSPSELSEELSDPTSPAIVWPTPPPSPCTQVRVRRQGCSSSSSRNCSRSSSRQQHEK